MRTYDFYQLPEKNYRLKENVSQEKESIKWIQK